MASPAPEPGPTALVVRAHPPWVVPPPTPPTLQPASAHPQEVANLITGYSFPSVGLPDLPSSPSPQNTPAHPQEVANFIVSEARKNSHAPNSMAEEEDMLIYNWPPSYTGKVRGCKGAGGREGWGNGTTYFYWGCLTSGVSSARRLTIVALCLHEPHALSSEAPFIHETTGLMLTSLAPAIVLWMMHWNVHAANSVNAVPLTVYMYCVQHKYKGEEVDFDESYFFPPWEEFKRTLEERRQREEQQQQQDDD